MHLSKNFGIRLSRYFDIVRLSTVENISKIYRTFDGRNFRLRRHMSKIDRNFWKSTVSVENRRYLSKIDGICQKSMVIFQHFRHISQKKAIYSKYASKATKMAENSTENVKNYTGIFEIFDCWHIFGLLPFVKNIMEFSIIFCKRQSNFAKLYRSSKLLPECTALI